MVTNDDTPPLSPRERQIIEMASQGFTDAGISNQLGISEATVSTYWGRVRIKLGPHSRTELVSIYLRNLQQQELSRLKEENDRLVEAIRLASSANRDPDHFYKALIENAPDPILVVSTDGILVFANVAAHNAFGYEYNQLNAKLLEILLPDSLRDKHREHVASYVENPATKQMGMHVNTPALHKDGSIMDIQASLSLLETHEGSAVICILRVSPPPAIGLSS